MRARTTVPIWLIPLNFALVLIVGILAARVLLLDHPLPDAQMQALRLVYRQIEAEHVAPREGDDLMWSAIEGMVNSLDRHSEFIRPSGVADFEEQTTGSYEGIGIRMVRDATPATVEFPMVGGPAERAGLLPGDRIVAVDGVPLEAAEGETVLEAARRALLGPAGTDVRLQIERGDGERLERTLTRGAVQRRSVKWATLHADNIGYIYLSAFQHNTTEELREAVLRLDTRAEGGLAALILDLRFNPGGLLEQAVGVTNLFLAQGRIVTLRRRHHEVERHEAVAERCVLPRTPIVILVNGSSASASEVVSGALQDHGRARVVGERTFGKGVVQSIYRWQDLAFRLKLTTAHYYTPNGRNIEGENRRPEDGQAEGGIPPDIEVPVDDAIQHAVARSVHSVEVPERYAAAVQQLAERFDFPVAQPPSSDADPQLEKALEVARQLAAGG